MTIFDVSLAIRVGGTCVTWKPVPTAAAGPQVIGHWEIHALCAGPQTWEDLFVGFHSHGGTPKGWFIMENPNLEWMSTGGLGHPHMLVNPPYFLVTFYSLLICNLHWEKGLVHLHFLTMYLLLISILGRLVAFLFLLMVDAQKS